MLTRFLNSSETYDGTQLTSLRNYLSHGLLGDSIVSWVGPCAIPNEHMVDGEDLRAGAEIRGAKMLHFIVEKFETSLFTAVVLQRMLSAIALEQIAKPDLRRDGDDIYLGKKKLSISIATQSPVSSLIHFAMNVNNVGTPIETLSLEDLRIEAKVLAEKIMTAFSSELASMLEASRKVRWVR